MEQLYRFVKASERLPKSTHGFAKQICLRFSFEDGYSQLRNSTVNQFLDTIKISGDLNKIEWLEEAESNVPDKGWKEKFKHWYFNDANEEEKKKYVDVDCIIDWIEKVLPTIKSNVPVEEEAVVFSDWANCSEWIFNPSKKDWLWCND